MVMREWLRQGGPVSGGFAEETREAMAGCLACKACVSQCPIHVDVPEFKARFQEAYYARNHRPVRDRIVAGFERVAGPASTFASIARSLGGTGLAKTMMGRIGLVDMPEFVVPNLKARLNRAGFGFLAKSQPESDTPTVVILQDAFTSLFDPRVVVDTCRLMSVLGHRVFVHPFFENGKALHIKGYLARLRQVVARNVSHLLDLQSRGYTLVAVEPSVALTYRDEYVLYGPPAARELRVQTIQEWLMSSVPGKNRRRPDQNPGSATLFPHCMESAGDAHLTEAWKPVFSHFGVDLAIEQVGCCGMAGIYGHESEHADISRKIFDQNWGPQIDRIETETGRTILATGFSCRHQSARCAANHLQHPVSYLAHKVEF